MTTEQFKQSILDHLTEQGYSNLQWEDVILLYSHFADNPLTPLQNEIDSLLTGNEEFEDFIGTEQDRVADFIDPEF